MKKRSLFIGVALLISMALVFNGCETEVEKEVPGSETLLWIDEQFDSIAGLSAALQDTAYSGKVLGLRTAADSTLTADVTVPSGYTVVLFSTVKTDSGADFVVDGGIVHVGYDGILVAEDGNVVVKGAGHISVQPGGLLSTDAVANVNNGADGDAKATVLGNAVTFNGGTLKFSEDDDVDSKAKIETALGYLSSGALDIGDSGLALSVISTVSGTSATKKLVVGSITGTETENTLSIPAGLTIAIGGAPLGSSSTKELNVAGNLTLTGSSVNLAGTVSVTGALTLASGSSVTIPTDTEVTVASGGVFTAEDSGGDLKGTITVKSGGISKDFANNGSGGGVWKAGSSGKYVFEKGAKAYLGNDLIIGADTDAWVQLTKDGTTFSNSLSEYELDGEATVSHNFGFNGIECTLTAGSKLTIAINDEMSDAQKIWPGFWVGKDEYTSTYGTIEGAASGDTASVIEIKQPTIQNGFGWLTFFVANSSSTDNVNFYDSDGNSIATGGNIITGTDPLQVRIPFGVYKWDASLDSNAGGWKAQAATP